MPAENHCDTQYSPVAVQGLYKITLESERKAIELDEFAQTASRLAKEAKKSIGRNRERLAAAVSREFGQEIAVTEKVEVIALTKEVARQQKLCDDFEAANSLGSAETLHEDTISTRVNTNKRVTRRISTRLSTSSVAKAGGSSSTLDNTVAQVEVPKRKRAREAEVDDGEHNKNGSSTAREGRRRK